MFGGKCVSLSSSCLETEMVAKQERRQLKSRMVVLQLPLVEHSWLKVGTSFSLPTVITFRLSDDGDGDG